MSTHQDYPERSVEPLAMNPSTGEESLVILHDALLLAHELNLKIEWLYESGHYSAAARDRWLDILLTLLDLPMRIVYSDRPQQG